MCLRAGGQLQDRSTTGKVGDYFCKCVQGRAHACVCSCAHAHSWSEVYFVNKWEIRVRYIFLCEFDLHLRNGAKRSKLNWPHTGRGRRMAQELTRRQPPKLIYCNDNSNNTNKKKERRRKRRIGILLYLSVLHILHLDVEK